jgi:hypothetical protein
MGYSSEEHAFDVHHGQFAEHDASRRAEWSAGRSAPSRETEHRGRTGARLRARRALRRRRRHRALAARGRRRRRPGDGDCASSPTSKTFMPWLDPANCVPAPGAMPRQRAHGTSEAEPPCWRAKEPFRVGAPDDQASLRLPPGSSAATAPMCIGIEHPTVRFSRNARPARCSTRSGSTRSSLTRQATTTSCRAGSSSAPATGCPPRHWSSASTRSP